MTIRAPDFLDEMPHPVAVLQAGRKFDSAGDVDAPWPREDHGIESVLGCQPTGEQPWFARVRWDARPVEGLAAPTFPARRMTVEQESRSTRVTRPERFRGGLAIIATHCHRLEIGDAKAAAERIVLVTVELQQGRAHVAHDVAHFLLRVVAEQGHGID